MILRGLASVVVVGLLGVNLLLPRAEMTARGAESRIRADVEVSEALAVGRPLPGDWELFSLDGRRLTREDLLGHRVLLTFERSVDW